ncbi:MAG: thioredoxin domain-containing protein [Deltaproteobacteria bacterium]|nr:thioredoxin domain-containing protein [Deltaproteobacteria bacterium]
MKKKKEITPLPFNYYLLPMTAILICGLLASVYLSISHYRVYTDISYKSFCAISKSINCDTVSQSPYSIFIDVPVPAWGIFGYAFFLVMMTFAWNRKAEKKRMWSVLIIIAAGYSIYSIILAVISTFYIHSYCIMCIVTYGVNLLLLFYAWLIKKRFDSTGLIQGLKLDIRFLWKMKFSTMPVIMLFLLCLSLLLISFPQYWRIAIPSVSIDMPKGLTEDGHPWIGAENPELVITEFTDYRCFQCKKMHFYLRGLVDGHPDKIRLIHRHFPMDHEYNEIVKKPFHVGSGKLSLLAIYATEKEKFWEMNDLLFNLDRSKSEINIKDLAQKTGLDFRGLAGSLHNRIIRKKLQIDIWKGMKLRITGTPGYLIEGKVYLANIPPEIIKKIID